MGPFCFDLDDTVTSTPDQMRAIMAGLRAQGHQVHVLSAAHNGKATPNIVAQKRALLKSLGCANCYDRLAVVDGGKKKVVAANKVAYLRRHDAAALIDNNKTNVKAATRAGVLALRHMDPKGANDVDS
jgi:hypothetical protein